MGGCETNAGLTAGAKDDLWLPAARHDTRRALRNAGAAEIGQEFYIPAAEVRGVLVELCLSKCGSE